MRILMTGSQGLVGSVMTARLGELGHAVVPFDILHGDDVRDRAQLDRAAADCDGIVHLAAISRVAWGEERPDLCESVNVGGTEAVVDMALAAPRKPWLLFTSSREVYGNPTDAIITEDAPVAPVNVYGRSKAAGETVVARGRAEGLRTATIRLSNVYGGRRDHPDRAVPSLVARARAGQDLTITGADNYFDFVHVEDTVAGLIAVLDQIADGAAALPPIHLATGIATTLEALAGLAIAATRSRSAIIRTAPRAFDVSGFCGNPARAARLLGWKPAIMLDEGVARVAASLRDDGPLPEAEIPDPELLRLRHSGR